MDTPPVIPEGTAAPSPPLIMEWVRPMTGLDDLAAETIDVQCTMADPEQHA